MKAAFSSCHSQISADDLKFGGKCILKFDTALTYSCQEGKSALILRILLRFQGKNMRKSLINSSSDQNGNNLLANVWGTDKTDSSLEDTHAEELHWGGIQFWLRRAQCS